MGGSCRCGRRWSGIARIRRARCATCAWIRSASRSRISMRSAAGATTSGGVPVDASAVFADGTPIDGVAGLRAFILKHQDSYVHTFVSKLLTYALGRQVDYRDQPAIRRIVRDAAAIGLSLVGDRSRYRVEHAVPDGKDRLMMITKRALSRRTVLRSLGAADSVAAPRFDGAGADGAARRPRRSRACGSARSTCRTASFPASGFPPPKARRSSSRRA